VRAYNASRSICPVDGGEWSASGSDWFTSRKEHGRGPQCWSRMSWNKAGSVIVTWHRGAFVQPLLQWKSKDYYIFGVCVCRRRYPACNTHAPCCHLWPVRLYNFKLPQEKHDFRKKKNTMTEHKMRVLIFSTIVSETFLILRRNEQDIMKNVYLSSCKVPVILVRF